MSSPAPGYRRESLEPRSVGGRRGRGGAARGESGVCVAVSGRERRPPAGPHADRRSATLFVRRRGRAAASRRSPRSSSTRRTRATLGRALGISRHPALDAIHARVREKLEREPVEDYRIDFEDGYGVHPNADEDRQVGIVAREIARGMRERTLPPSIGLRIKPLTEELRERSVRTLDLLITALVDAGGLPPNWVITVPKITVVEQVTYVVAVLRNLERSLGLADRNASLRDHGRGPAGDHRCERAVASSQAARRKRWASDDDRLRDVRLHRGIQHHRGASASATSGVRLRETVHSGFVCRNRNSNRRWIDGGAAGARPRTWGVAHRAAARGESGRGARRLDAAFLRRPILARRRILSGLGSAPGATRLAIRGRRELLPRGDRRRRARVSRRSSTRRQPRHSSAACSTSRRRGRGCSASSCAPCSAGAITESEALRLTGLTADELRATLDHFDSAISWRCARRQRIGMSGSVFELLDLDRALGARDRRNHVDRQLDVVQLARPQSRRRLGSEPTQCTARHDLAAPQRRLLLRREDDARAASRCRIRCTGSSGRRTRRGSAAWRCSFVVYYVERSRRARRSVGRCR